MAKCFLIALLVAALVAHQISADSITIEDDSSPEPSPEYYSDAPDDGSELANSPAFSYDNELMHRYSLERLQYLYDCSKKLNSRCEAEVSKNMLDDTPLSRDCCVDLLKMGQDCHLGLVQFIFSTYEYKNIASTAVPRSKHTWNVCVDLVGNEIGAPVSLEI